jgi:hypothetical protein
MDPRVEPEDDEGAGGGMREVPRLGRRVGRGAPMPGNYRKCFDSLRPCAW